MCNIPGPLAPPCIRRPKRNITARSYSCTTCQRIQYGVSCVNYLFYFHSVCVSITINLFAYVWTKIAL